MSKWKMSELNDLTVKIQQLSATDEKFRKDLLANSKEVIEKTAGRALPEGFSIKIIEQDPSHTATILLPRFIGNKLNDEALEGVAGGKTMEYERPALRAFNDVEADVGGIAVVLVAVLWVWP